jgi:small subunit ribosomal protein S8
MKLAIAGLLKQEGYIRDFSTQTQSHPQGLLEIVLKYDAASRSVIRGLRKISTPGKRKYVACKAMPRVLEGTGIAIISTSRGLLTDRQCVADNVGGEVVCFIW